MNCDGKTRWSGIWVKGLESLALDMLGLPI